MLLVSKPQEDDDSVPLPANSKHCEGVAPQKLQVLNPAFPQRSVSGARGDKASVSRNSEQSETLEDTLTGVWQASLLVGCSGSLPIDALMHWRAVKASL